MYIVEKVFDGQTPVFMTAKVYQAITKYDKDRSRSPLLLDKIEIYAHEGFDKYHGGPLRAEGGGVFRIGLESLFRVYGFFSIISNEPKRKNCFIAVETYQKRGQSRGKKGDNIVKKVQRSRTSRSGWKLK